MFDNYNDDYNFYNDNFYILSFIQVMYLPTIYFIYHYMKDKEPINCKTCMGLWNTILSIFSMYCTYYITIPVLNTEHIWEDAVCSDIIAYDDLKLNKWRSFFVLSKFPEMIDTLWIALRKRKITTLQVWHHFSVCLYCWVMVIEKHSETYITGGHSTYFAAMNSFVHSIMYSYYAVVSMTPYRSKIVAQSITFIQTLQMLLGILILLYKTSVCEIQTNIIEIIFSYVMYGSYLYLFGVYYYNRYNNKIIEK